MLCNVLDEHHSFPGLALLLGGLVQYVNTKQPNFVLPGIVASSYLIRWQGEGRILDDHTGLFAADGIFFQIQATHIIRETLTFFDYLTELLESPERSGTHIFDQQRYATAAKECFQLHLCSRCKFSKGTPESTHRNKALRWSKPSTHRISRLGIHSRIRNSWRHFEVLRRRAIESKIVQHSPNDSFPENSPEHQYYQFLSYRWALDLLAFLLEKSTVSSGLGDVLRDCTFSMMAWEFPRRMQLAKKAIARYLLRVESAAGEA